MHLKILISLFLFSSSIIFCQQDSVLVSIVVFIEGLNPGEEIYAAGNLSKLGNWDPAGLKFEKVDDKKWKTEIYFPKGYLVEFKLTKGSWETERVAEDGSIPSNYYFKVFSDTTILLNACCWRDKFEYSFGGGITGTVEYHNDIKGEHLLPRDLIVWLPPSYFSDTTKSYPVLYMQDGQNIIDPSTASIGIDWQIDETADSLISTDEIEELIIVGIYNTQNRSLEYRTGDTSDYYMEYVVEKIKPMIDSIYRTKSDRENTAVAGSSLSGLITFRFLWEYPEVFSKGAVISPALLIRDIDYVSVVKNSERKRDIRFSIGNGGVGLEAELQPGIDEMLVALEGKGYEIGEDFIWIKDEGAEHNEKAWAERVPIWLKFLFGKK